MGCWDGTCGITDLPISAGEEVMAFVLVRPKGAHKGISGLCYPDDHYRPFTPPFEGAYDDSGGVENIKESWVTRLLAENIQISDKDSELKYAKDLAGMINGVERGNGYYVTGGVPLFPSETYNLCLMLVRKDIYEFATTWMLDHIKKDDWFAGRYQEEVGTFRTFLEVAFKLSKDGGDPFYDHVCTHSKGILHSIRFNGLPGYDWPVSLMRNGNFDLEAVYDSVVGYHLFYNFLVLSRKSFRETCGTGSQTRAFDAMRDLAGKMMDICKTGLGERN